MELPPGERILFQHVERKPFRKGADPGQIFRRVGFNEERHPGQVEFTGLGKGLKGIEHPVIHGEGGEGLKPLRAGSVEHQTGAERTPAPQLQVGGVLDGADDDRLRRAEFGEIGTPGTHRPGGESFRPRRVSGDDAGRAQTSSGEVQGKNRGRVSRADDDDLLFFHDTAPNILPAGPNVKKIAEKDSIFGLSHMDIFIQCGYIMEKER